MPIDKKRLPFIVKNSMGLYAKEVILNRAIPDLRDGLKPVHRRILYMAYTQHLLHDKRYMKSAKLSGLVLALHAHGSSSVDGASVTLSQDWVVREPLIDIHGNNGGIDGSGAAASRYIEARLTYPAELLMSGINKNAIDMVDNYDSTMKEPSVLPASWPVAMVNGTSGIAVGLSTNIPPHNPLELLDGAIYLVDSPADKKNKLATIIKGPDFPTGGTIVGKDGIKEEFEHGTGKMVIRGTAHIDEKKNQIVITEVPFGVSTTRLTESIGNTLEPEKTALMVSSVDDATSTDVKIIVQFKKSAKLKQMQTALNLLYKKSDLQTTFSAQNYMIWNQHPIIPSMKEYLLHFLSFREETLKRILNFDNEKKQARLNIVDGLIKLIDISDKVIKDARNSNGKQDFQNILMKKYHFNEEQAKSIAVMPLYRLGKQDAISLAKEQKELHADLDKIHLLLSSENEFKKYLKNDLRNTKKVFKDSQRKTKIIDSDDVKEIKIDKTALIKKKDALVVAKRNGVVQRMSQQVYDNNIGDYADKDNIVATIKSNTRQGALFFTKFGLAYFRFVDSLENTNVKNDPDSVQQTITSYKANDETIGADAFNMKSEEKRYIVSVTKYGAVKVTDETSVVPNTNTKAYLTRTTKYNGLKNRKKHADEEVIFVKALNQHDYDTLTLIITKTRGTTGRTVETNIKLSDMNVQGAAGSGSQKVKLSEKMKETITNIELH